MKIDILCNDGSPLGVTPDTVYGDSHQVGVGGAELALLTMAEAWAKEHEVVLYNNPWYATEKLEQRSIPSFDPNQKRDVLIVFRSPNHLAYRAKGKKIWWSCDQQTIGSFSQFKDAVHRVVTISPRHQEFFRQAYGIESVCIDLPVRVWDYEFDALRVKNQLLYTSMPERGLDILSMAFPKIRAKVPDATLVITSDRRLWGHPADNGHFRHKFLGQAGVNFIGAVPRHELVQYQKSSDVLAYPCIYDELFCIAVAEAQVSGAYPITSQVGAVATTNMAKTVGGNPTIPMWHTTFVDAVVDFLLKGDGEKESIRTANMELAKRRFGLPLILDIWNEVVFNA